MVFDAVPGSPPREQLHVDADDTHVALHGDRVLVKVKAGSRDRGDDDWGTGTVVRVTIVCRPAEYGFPSIRVGRASVELLPGVGHMVR